MSVLQVPLTVSSTSTAHFLPMAHSSPAPTACMQDSHSLERSLPSTDHVQQAADDSAMVTLPWCRQRRRSAPRASHGVQHLHRLQETVIEARSTSTSRAHAGGALTRRPQIRRARTVGSPPRHTGGTTVRWASALQRSTCRSQCPTHPQRPCTCTHSSPAPSRFMQSSELALTHNRHRRPSTTGSRRPRNGGPIVLWASVLQCSTCRSQCPAPPHNLDLRQWRTGGSRPPRNGGHEALL